MNVNQLFQAQYAMEHCLLCRPDWITGRWLPCRSHANEAKTQLHYENAMRLAVREARREHLHFIAICNS